MDSSVKLGEPLFQSVSIFFPRHPIYSRRRPPLQAVVAAAEQLEVHVVQQGREL
jgi:hypothetical protein